ncbi:MAG TPA: [LysW]-lysine hydrolase, partial [Ktedonobacteraceae bacterium]
IAGGVPMGVICPGSRVMESGRITRGVHGSTFGGNPLACAAALATLDIIEQESLPERAAALGEHALERLRAVRTPLIREVRGRGLLLGIELTRRAQPYLEKLTEQGVIALLAGQNVIRLLPPLVITDEQLGRVLDVVEEVVTEGDANQVGSEDVVEEVVTEGDANQVGSLARATARVAPTIHEISALYGRGGARGRHGVGDAGNTDTEICLLHNMLTIPSYSSKESVLAHYLVEQAQQIGLHSRVDDTGNFIASTHPLDCEIQEQPIILLGHMDTVRGYIPVRLQDGLLYGRGAVDAKGPLAAFLCATSRLAHSMPFDSCLHPVIVIGAVEEESATSRGARAVVERYRPSACIIGEPSGSQAVTIGYKGRLLVEYSLTRPIHHSAGLQQNSSEIAIAFWNRVRNHAAERNEQQASHSVFASLQPSLRSINSSQDGLEEQTQLLIGFRLPPGYDIADLRTQLEQWAYQDEARISFSGEEVAFQSTRTTSLSRTFISAIRAAGGQPVFKHKTGTSDMNVVGPIWGQNIVAYGPGDSRLDHTPQEHLQISEYIQAIDVLETVLRELAFRGKRCHEITHYS